MNFKQNQEFNSSLVLKNLYNKYDNLQRNQEQYIQIMSNHLEFLLN